MPLDDPEFAVDPVDRRDDPALSYRLNLGDHSAHSIRLADLRIVSIVRRRTRSYVSEHLPLSPQIAVVT